MKGNKGEWSELYTVFKLLSEGKLYAADENLNKIEDIFFPILKILSPSDNGMEFHIDSKIKILDSNTGRLINEIPIKTITEGALIALEKIKSSNSTFSIPELEGLFQDLQLTKFKSSSANKSDITIVIHDTYTGYTPTLSFSIKSKLGNASTLFNASQSTNFTFKMVEPLTDSELADINSIDGRRKLRDRLSQINGNNTLKFDSVENVIFNNNLLLIDSALPRIISECLLIYYSGESTGRLTDILEILKTKNPLSFPDDFGFYTYKIKSFLKAVALGMQPTQPWDGMYYQPEKTNAYIIV